MIKLFGHVVTIVQQIHLFHSPKYSHTLTCKSHSRVPHPHPTLEILLSPSLSISCCMKVRQARVGLIHTSRGSRYSSTPYSSYTVGMYQLYHNLFAHLKLLKNTFPVSAPYELQHLLLPILLSDIVLSMMVITHPVCGYAAYKIAGRKRRLVIVIVPSTVMFSCAA